MAPIFNKAVYEKLCKHRKEFTEEELLEMDLAEEADMKRTQRAYNLMNRDHWRMMMGTDPKTIKFKKVVKLLKKEKKNIETDLKIATSYYKIKTDQEVMEKIKELMEENSKFDKDIKVRKTEIEETEDMIRKVGKEVYKLRNEQLTDEALTRKAVEGQTVVDALENKLNVQEKKFGKIMHENHQLREEIEHYLKDRMNFKSLWDRLVGKLNRGKKVLMDLIEQCTVTYNQRDDVVQTLNLLRTKCHQDLVKDKEEMEVLSRSYAHSEKLARFIEIKEQKRIMGDMVGQFKAKKRLEMVKMKEDIEKFTDILYEMQNYFQTTNVESIPKKYDVLDNTNISKLKLVMEINSDIEEIGRELSVYLVKIEEEQKLVEHRTDQQQINLEKYQQKLDEATNRTEESLEEQQRMDQYLENIYNGVWNLFTKSNCSMNPFLPLLGDNTRIHRFNVLLFIDNVQQQIGELIVFALYKQKETRRKEKRQVKKAQLVVKEEKLFPLAYHVDEFVSQNPCPLCVELEMVSDVIDTLQFAKTKEEVKQFLVERLALPDGLQRLHSVSLCNLPKSREIIQRRYH